ncbi:MAG: hypothetical protein D6756_01020, partial [Cyanobacteria bacterium J083]
PQNNNSNIETNNNKPTIEQKQTTSSENNSQPRKPLSQTLPPLEEKPLPKNIKNKPAATNSPE